MLEYVHIHLRFASERAAWSALWALAELGAAEVFEWVRHQVKDNGSHVLFENVRIASAAEIERLLLTDGGTVSTSVVLANGATLEIDWVGHQTASHAREMKGPAHLSIKTTGRPYHDPASTSSPTDHEIDLAWRPLLELIIGVLEPDDMLVSPSYMQVGEFWESATYHRRAIGFIRDLWRAHRHLLTGEPANADFFKDSYPNTLSVEQMPFEAIWNEQFAFDADFWGQYLDDIEAIRSIRPSRFETWRGMTEEECVDVIQGLDQVRYTVVQLDHGWFMWRRPFLPSFPFLAALARSLD